LRLRFKQNIDATMFGNKKNVGYCSWVPRNFAFETHGKGKQVGAASCAGNNAAPCCTVQ